MTPWTNRMVIFIALVFTPSSTLIVKRQASLFLNGQIKGTVGSSRVVEASGLGASRRHPGVLYVHNDSGDDAEIHAIDAMTGKRLATFVVSNAVNHDWEDLAVGPCSDDTVKTCIYIADMGEKGGRGAVNIIYRLEEPAYISDASITATAKIRFSWNQTDAETLLVDPNGEVYVISKVQGGRGMVAHLPKTAWGSGSVTVSVIPSVTLPITSTRRDPVGGDISPDGSEILVKGVEDKVFYWKLREGETYTQAMSRAPSYLPCKAERQGETVCWSATGTGYYTLSEGEDQSLYYYLRNW